MPAALGTAARQSLLRAIQHLQKGELGPAETLSRQALAMAPGSPDALHVLGMVQARRGDSGGAVASLQRALDQRRDFPEAAADLANLLLETGRPEEAVETARKALRRSPSAFPLMNAMGLALRRTNRFAEAAQILERAVDLQPKAAEARHNLANAYRHLDRNADAERLWRAVLADQPGFLEAWHDLGALLKDQARFAEAEAAFRKALALKPDYDSAAKALGILLLSEGRLREGWGPYERRFGKDPGRPEPAWDGGDLEGRTLLVWGEQGIGDQILFASLLPLLEKRAGRFRLAVESRLVPLFRRSFPGVDVCLLEAGRTMGDVQCAMTSLGRVLNIGAEDLPAANSYLKPDPERRASLRERYGPGPLVGLSWHSKRADFGHRKSTSLADFAAILGIPGITFVDLQYGSDPQEVAEAARIARFIHDPEIDSLKDLDSFTAQVAAMDLVISVSNSTVHFAGGLGVPCWVMLPAGHGLLWYWGHHGETTGWYPSLRLLRQHQASDWSGPMNQAAGELARRFPA